MRFRHSLAILLGAALAAQATPALAGPVLQPAASVAARIGDCEIQGEAELITTNTLVIKHRSASGKLRKQHTLDVSGGGWKVDCPGPRVRGGDRLQLFRQGSSSPFKVFTVPRLTLTTDRAHDRVFGKAPGVAAIDLAVTLCDVAGFGCTSLLLGDVPVKPSTKTWSHTSADPLRGGGRITVTWKKGSDLVSLEQSIAQLIVRPGSPVVTGTGRTAGLRESIVARRGSAVASAKPRTRADARFTAAVRRNGTKRAIKAGDVIRSSIAGNAAFTVPPTSITLLSTGVEGTCAANRRVTILVKSLAGLTQGGYLRQTDANGHWEVLDPVPPDTRVEAWCSTPAGDAIVRTLVTP